MLFGIALALLSSRSSFSSSLIRCASSVVVPGRVPWSIWAFLTQVRRASGWTPSSRRSCGSRPWPAPGQPASPTPVLVARSRSSSGYLVCPMAVILTSHHCPHQTQGGSSRRTDHTPARRQCAERLLLPLRARPVDSLRMQQRHLDTPSWRQHRPRRSHHPQQSRRTLAAQPFVLRLCAVGPNTPTIKADQGEYVRQVGRRY